MSGMLTHPMHIESALRMGACSKIPVGGGTTRRADGAGESGSFDVLMGYLVSPLHRTSETKA
ncbi:hypothetical protein CRI94_16190 [Longibacter salinarum]|uniref:Uncharacterized protein n=1 Tax=Longibacter salinarum TaxID=1850348 RepID=A0A2A8CU13_9BACT|nr:hypothetical protein CRI94_16190 [Longibacter salinarum]